MQLKKILQKKEETEYKITALISKFYKETTLDVLEIELKSSITNNMELKYKSNLKVEL